MKSNDNLQTTNDSKKYYIPMEVTPETVRDYGIDPAEVRWARIGNRKVQAVMVPATKEQYLEYMRPLWRDQKREQRRDPIESLEKMSETIEVEIADSFNVEEHFIKKDDIERIKAHINNLDETDRKIILLYVKYELSEAEIGKRINRSQKYVNKHKHKVFDLLKQLLETLDD